MARAELAPSGKSPEAFRTIREVSEELDVPQHVLRFWETRFAQVRPLKRGGGRRYYRPEDVALLHAIWRQLYGEGYTIRGVQKLLREGGVDALLEGPAPPRTVGSGIEGETRARVEHLLAELSTLRDMLRGRVRP